MNALRREGAVSDASSVQRQSLAEAAHVHRQQPAAYASPRAGQQQLRMRESPRSRGSSHESPRARSLGNGGWGADSRYESPRGGGGGWGLERLESPRGGGGGGGAWVHVPDSPGGSGGGRGGISAYGPGGPLTAHGGAASGGQPWLSILKVHSPPS